MHNVVKNYCDSVTKLESKIIRKLTDLHTKRSLCEERMREQNTIQAWDKTKTIMNGSIIETNTLKQSFEKMEAYRVKILWI